MANLDLDLKAAAAKIGRSPWTTRYYVRTGRIPYHRPGGGRGKLAFDSEEIDRWLEDQRGQNRVAKNSQRDAKGRYQPVPA